MNQSKLINSHQSYMQLAAIQLSGWTSLPILATSILVLQVNSFLGAALTIIVGNAILWFIRLGIITMSHDRRQSTLDLAQEYFGKLGSYFVAVLLLTSTFVWFLIQTTTASNALTHLVSLQESPDIDQFVQASVILGLTSTFLCMEGIVLLRRLSVIAFPILFVTFVVILYHLPHFSYTNGNPLSLAGLSLVLATNLGITADMPTFFRHSNSWADSIKALGLTQVVTLLLGLGSLFLGTLINGIFEVNQTILLQSNFAFLRYALILFIFTSAVCTNVANVYSASVGWELVAPKALIGRQEYLILGLGLTTIYILLANYFSPLFLLTFSDDALVNLSLVLVIAYIVSRSRNASPSSREKMIYFLAWAFSSMLNALQLIYNPFPKISSLLVSFTMIVLVIALPVNFFEWRKRRN